jgi:DNA-binding NarL/FixJ family response regulator
VIRVLIVDRLRSMCGAMQIILRDERDLKVVGVVTSVDEAVSRLTSCDVVLVSVSLSAHQALEFVRMVTNDYPGIKVLVMDLANEQEPTAPYLEAGAVGCILEDDSIDDLLAKVRAAQNAQVGVP